ncbi:hypothetical protein [Pseudomonas fluorescens]|uniref:hypothetical protein n=1 Tax=Pseudomonas fluorescens TaxID=294 RepID=UPI00123FE166|nr:hypothetical protein [Pseudomonas fluorescens]
MYAGVAMGMLSLLLDITLAGTIACQSGYQQSKNVPTIQKLIQFNRLRETSRFSERQAEGIFEKVRNFLRSTAQLFAHLALDHVNRGLQGNWTAKYYDQLRNFLRTSQNTPSLRTTPSRRSIFHLDSIRRLNAK